MQDTWKKVYVGITMALVVLGLVSCASYQLYNRDMAQGKALLAEKEYAGAAQAFESAYAAQKDGVALTFLATADYRLGKLDAAQKAITEAEKLGVSTAYSLRMQGYKALILLKKKDAGGVDALNSYVTSYSRLYPLNTLAEVDKMAKTGRIDLPRLEVLIEEQVAWYEEAMEELYRTGTGPLGPYYKR